MLVAASSSIVPGTCAYPAPRAFGRRRVHRRKESEEGEKKKKKKRKRSKRKVTAVRSEPSGETLKRSV